METQDRIDQNLQTTNEPNAKEQRVHHHARLNGDNENLSHGTVRTLCGMTIKTKARSQKLSLLPSVRNAHEQTLSITNTLGS